MNFNEQNWQFKVCVKTFIFKIRFDQITFKILVFQRSLTKVISELFFVSSNSLSFIFRIGLHCVAQFILKTKIWSRRVSSQQACIQCYVTYNDMITYIYMLYEVFSYVVILNYKIVKIARLFGCIVLHYVCILSKFGLRALSVKYVKD